MLFIVLAAGQGKRMNSDSPKVLQSLAGQPMICHLLDTLQNFDAKKAIVFGHKGEQLQHALSNYEVEWIYQKELLGTGHAVVQALPLINADEKIVSLFGDTPLVSVTTLERLLAIDADLAILTGVVDNPFGYGRILRDEKNAVIDIVEEKDATDQQRQIQEINTGIIAARGAVLQELLPLLTNDNTQGEYYLTDLIGLAVGKNYRVEAYITDDIAETSGINDRLQLANAESIVRQQRAEALLKSGVTLVDPQRIDIQGELTIGRDVYIEPNVIFKGKNIIGNNVRIEANSVIINCTIEDNVEILSHCRLEDSYIGKNALIGPFARLRPKTVLAEGVKVGNFVEIKATTVEKNSKINHLSYIGDATVGANVNIGAGTITCNYDGANKHQTVISDDVFIGSNTALVAPIRIGYHATIGAGSTIRKDTKAESLTFTFGEIKEKENWQRPKKKK